MKYGTARWSFGWGAGVAFGMSVPLLLNKDAIGLIPFGLAIALFVADWFYEERNE